MIARTTTVLSLLLLATSALSFSLNPLNILSRRASDPDLNYAFFVNCWAQPGARSEVDWFSSYPTDFGNAKPESSEIINDSSNFEWENGGTAPDPSGSVLTWGKLTKNASTNSQAGTATDGPLKYMVLRDTDSTLYTDNDFNCIVVYRLQQIGGTTTTSEPPSSNATQVPDTTTSSTAPATTSATTTPTAVPVTNNSSSSDHVGIGVGVGVGVGGALVLGALAFFIWQRRRAAKNRNEPMQGVYSEKKGAGFPGGGPGAAEAGAMGGAGGYGAAPGHGQLRAELHHDPLNELGGDGRVAEAPADGSRPTYELDGGMDTRR